VLLCSHSCDDKFVQEQVLQGCGRLRGSISYFLATRSSQVIVDVANDVEAYGWQDNIGHRSAGVTMILT